MELTPKNIRDVRFREKLRGYNPEDVDAFINDVVQGVEKLQQQLAEQAARLDAAESKPYEASDVEESLRRTLVLAQRTADMAVREAQEEATRLLSEATAEREAVVAEAAELRAGMMADVEAEVHDAREHLYSEREALARDIAALHGYLEQERERLRIYFTEQLRRVEDGVPGLPQPPAMEAPPRVQPEPAAAAVVAVGADGEGGDLDGAGHSGDGEEDDEFLAELRRAVHDTEPLGPRDDDQPPPPPSSDDSFDIFDDGESGGRFLRRKR